MQIEPRKEENVEGAAPVPQSRIKRVGLELRASKTGALVIRKMCIKHVLTTDKASSGYH